MASPYIHSSQSPVERPWAGMAMLAAVPLLSLVLVRMFWSGSSLWFLAVGIILLGVAAIVFLARRTQDQAYNQRTLDPEASKLPIVLTGLGVLFLAMLVLPNFSGGGTSSPQTLPAVEQQSAGITGSEVAGIAQDPVPQAPVVALPAAAEPAAAGETYLVQSGDTLWDIALRFETTVEAIVAANALTDEADLSVGQELVIPPAGAAAEDGDSTAEGAPAETLP